ncbi:MAG: hypothetical protein HY722_04070 [Planctomycetes bacterium]|nr:hypothetical protein [Planctomycetota bacterium]
MRLWHEHRSFILSVGAGLVLVLLGESLAASLAADPAGLGRLDREVEAGLQDMDAAFLRAEREAALTRRGLDAALQRRQESLAFPVAGEYLLRAGETGPDFYFRRVLEGTRREVKDLADRTNYPYPADLGFSDQIEADRVGELLARLACARALVEEAVRARTTGVDRIAHLPAERQPVKGAGEGARGVSLEALPMEVAVRGSPASVERFHRELSRPGRTLATQRVRWAAADEGLVLGEYRLARMSLLQGAGEAPASAPVEVRPSPSTTPWGRRSR